MNLPTRILTFWATACLLLCGVISSPAQELTAPEKPAIPPAPAAARDATPTPAPAPTPATPQPSTSAVKKDEVKEAMTDVQFPNTPIPVILLEYERLTGKRVIRDTSIQDKTLIIQTSGKMTYSEAAEFIEKSFLLNGYAILPTEKPDQMKIIAYNTEKKPSSEGLPIFTNPIQLPDSDQVITYIMPLSYISPDEAVELFSNVIVLHPYGKLTPLSTASAVVITESASVVRRLIELRDSVDVSKIRTLNQAFQLERSEAEDVVEALTDILGLDKDQPSTAPNSGSASPTAGPRQQPQKNASAPVHDSGSSIIPSQMGTNSAFARPTAPKPRIRAIPRANRILVVATPEDMDYIEGLITHLDAPVENATFMRRQLRYMSVSDFLVIAKHLILRGREDKSGGEIAGKDGQQNQNTLGGGMGGNDMNRDTSGLGGNSRRGSAGSGDLGNAGQDQAAAPQSAVVGKTLLVADNVQNMLIASGPPEDLRQIAELLDSMDARPVQIQISAIIAQLTLGDDYDLAINLLRTMEQPTGDARHVNGSRFNGAGTFTTLPDQKLFDINNLFDPAKLATANSGFAFYGQFNRYLDGHLSALEKTNRFKVLQRPSIYTVNNREAVIETGQRVAVPRSTLSSLDTGGINMNNQVVTASIDFENVVLRIAVRPLINTDGQITLQIQQRNDDIVGSTVIGGDSIPTIGTQTLGTTVMVPDGGTVLLGGLISENDSKSESGLPLFANLPFIGRVFGSTTDKLARKELLIFIQPKIIRDEIEQTIVDNDLRDRTRIAPAADDFAEKRDNNLDVFESQDFNSAEKRVFFFRNLFRKKPSVRAVPVE